MPTNLRDHPLRRAVSDEVHARPFPTMRAPERASHIAVLSGEVDASGDRAYVARLCEAYGQVPPPPTATHFIADFDGFRLRWERHTEFSTYSFFRHGPFADPFADPAIGAAPAAWLGEMPGQVLVAVHVALEDKAPPPRGRAAEVAELDRYFAPDSAAGSLVSDGAAAVWTDFSIHADGFGRILVRGAGLGERRAGRLVRRLLEIETYRTMALLAFPLARDTAPQVTRIDRGLTEITARMAALEDLDDERRLLDTLMQQAAEVERLVAATSYRFGAARAYHALVERRVAELREERIPGLQTIGEFMERRFAPAMRTCESTVGRLEALAERVARASNLLRTRVDIALEGQNRDVLLSMNRRARLQLRLQQTVEGLSVAAISYYLVGLVGYAGKAAHAAGLAVDADLLVGASIPVVVAVVWLMMRRLRRRLRRDDDPAGD